MGSTFLFYAVKAETGEAVKCEVHLGGRFRGYTPDRKNQFLEVETEMTGSYNWYAKRHGDNVAYGASKGGKIKIVV